jgi:hypothetical protein
MDQQGGRVTLADRIIQHGPYFGGDPSPFTGFDYADLNQLRDELIAGRRVTTHEEWRVTGTLPSGKPFATKFEHEVAARRLLDRGRAMGWTDGPHLHKRTVTVSDWTEVDA